MKPCVISGLVCLAAALPLASASAPSIPPALIVEAESGVFTGTVDEHCCWRNILQHDALHSTHSGKG